MGQNDLDADVIVIGGGAAGMMAACTAAETGASVLLLEKNEKLGKKIYITGKGRCNFTNACPTEDFFAQVPCNSRFLYSSIYGFDARMTMAWFEDQGMAWKVERGNRAFPVSDHASDVTRALEAAMRKAGVRVRLNCAAEELVLPRDDREKKRAANEGIWRRTDGDLIGVRIRSGEVVRAGAVILATGGLSYPTTGSTGDGYRLAKEAGHTVTATSPALVPLECPEEDLYQMQGLSLKNVNLTIRDGKKKVWEGFGEMMFTHFGVTGPLVLSASSDLADKVGKGNLTGEIDLKPAISEDQLDERLLREFAKSPNKEVRNVIGPVYPQKMIPVLLERAKIPSERVVNSLTKGERTGLTRVTKHFAFSIKGTRGFREAVITHGGVKVREVDPATMASKKLPGLFFCGEVLDVDAHTGGFNLQIAWSTGRAAGIGAAAYVREKG